MLFDEWARGACAAVRYRSPAQARLADRCRTDRFAVETVRAERSMLQRWLATSVSASVSLHEMIPR